MKILELMKRKQENNMENPCVTIAFLGDSVTQGCFELYQKNDTQVETIFDKTSAYHNYIANIFSVLFPSVPVNIINAGISGDSAPHALIRIERDVLKYSPDLTVVCFGLNDSGAGMDGIHKYTSALDGIFKKLKESGSEIIFMTPNMMNTSISPHLGKDFLEIAKGSMKTQCDGIMDAYMDAAREVCKENGIVICDCYRKWKLMSESGIETTELLANKINHPSRQMNWLFAAMLTDTILEN